MSRAAYNEIDPKAAAWLRELIKQGLIAPGDVIEASIEDLTANDLKPYTQVHFFAGIGVWSYALRAAGWADDRPVWTGSCPCQPFSAAGKGGGFDDERHLWPAFHYLIDQCRPDVVFGEQVASKDGLGWLDLVQADLEGTGYASGAVDLCAAGVGAPHIRQRLWWFGERLDDTAGARHVGQIIRAESNPRDETRLRLPSAGRGTSGLADGAEPGRQSWGRVSIEGNGRGSPWIESGRLRDAVGLDQHPGVGWEGSRGEPEYSVFGPERSPGGLADVNSDGQCESAGPGVRDTTHYFEPRGGAGGMADDRLPEPSGRNGAEADDDRRSGARFIEGVEPTPRGRNSRPGPTNGLWSDADWLHCRDGKWRPVEPGTFPLAHGAPERVGRLRGYGNAIVAPAAQAFIEAYLEAETDGGLSVTAASDLSHEMGVFA